MKRFSWCLTFILFLASCEKNTSVSSEKKIPSSSLKKESEEPLSEFENAEWRKKDSLAMEFVHLANTYEQNWELEKATILYKHASAMDHALPDVCLYTAHLCSKDRMLREKYLRKEIKRDKFFIRKNHPRIHEFKMALLQSFYQLKERDSLHYYARKFGIKPHDHQQVIETEMLYSIVLKSNSDECIVCSKSRDYVINF